MSAANGAWQIAPARSREEFLDQCRQALADGVLRPGDRIPNERLVASLTGLSRSTVREALGVLEREGHITRHVGRGTHVAAPLPPVARPHLKESPPTPAELMEFRLAVEPSLIDMIVLTAPDATLDHIAGIVAQGRQVVRWREAEEADRGFHYALFEATGNRLFIDLGQRLVKARGERAWLRLKEGSFSLEKWAIYQREHEAIVAALVDRHADSARNALRRHLGGVRANVQTVMWEI